MIDWYVLRTEQLPGDWELAVRCERSVEGNVVSIHVCLNGWSREFVIQIQRRAKHHVALVLRKAREIAMSKLPPADQKKHKSVLDCCRKCGRFAAPKGGLCDQCWDAEKKEGN